MAQIAALVTLVLLIMAGCGQQSERRAVDAGATSGTPPSRAVEYPPRDNRPSDGAATESAPTGPERRSVGPPCDVYHLRSAGSFVTWSPEGVAILVGQKTVLYQVAADGSGLRRIATAAADVVGGHAFAVAPDGGQIVYPICVDPFDSRLPHRYELVRANIDGSDRRRLTPTMASADYPAWSPDGTRLAVLADPDGERRPGLFTMAVDGSDLRPIVIKGEGTAGTGALSVSQPQWAPDGNRLAVTASFPGRKDRAVYIVGSDGSDQMRLAGAVSGPSWAPDGRRVAFAKADGDTVALHTIASDGTEERRVTTIEVAPPESSAQITRQASEAWIRTVAWSPDGAHLLFACGQSLCVVRVDGTPVGMSPIILDGGNVGAWSPDGTRIAVSSGDEPRRRSSGLRLYTMAPDGRDVRLLAVADGTGGLRGLGVPPPPGPVSVPDCETGSAVAAPAANPGLVADCATLLQIRDVLAGTAVLNWSTERPIVEWDGVGVGGAPLRVQGLWLVQLGLNGWVPPKLGGLTSLHVLRLSANALGGVIPPNLGMLAELSHLSLEGNHLSGPIPAALGELTNLEVLELSHNYQTGEIPATLGELPNLERVTLDGNHLTGCIPPGLQNPQKGDLGSLRLPACAQEGRAP